MIWVNFCFVLIFLLSRTFSLILWLRQRFQRVLSGATLLSESPCCVCSCNCSITTSDECGSRCVDCVRYLSLRVCVCLSLFLKYDMHLCCFNVPMCEVNFQKANNSVWESMSSLCRHFSRHVLFFIFCSLRSLLSPTNCLAFPMKLICINWAILPLMQWWTGLNAG